MKNVGNSTASEVLRESVGAAAAVSKLTEEDERNSKVRLTGSLPQRADNLELHATCSVTFKITSHSIQVVNLLGAATHDQLH